MDARQARRGFTLIELLVVLAIIAMLLSIAVPRYIGSLDKASEAVLAENLRLTREVIDKYYGDTGQYPDSLEQLVERRYLRALPRDPVTDSTQSWQIVSPPAGARGRVYDIRSSAPGQNSQGRPFAEM